MYKMSIDNIITGDKKLKIFPLRLGKRQCCSLSPLLVNIVLEIVTIAIRQEKDIKEIHIGKEKVKCSLFADEMIIYIEYPKEYLLEISPRNNNLIKQSGQYKINTPPMSLIYTCQTPSHKLV